MKNSICHLVKSIVLSIFLVGAIGSTALTQQHDIRFERLSIEDGLSQSSVYCILQDSRGFMWFGTDDGLNRYDGYHFTIYRHDPEDPHSISHNVVRALYEDRTGTLWIGTEGGGLNRFDRNTEQFIHYQHDPSNPKSLSHNAVSVIYEDHTSTLWIGTWGGGLDDFDRRTQTFIHYQPDQEDPESISTDQILSIYEDRAGTLWVGTWESGLERLEARATLDSPGRFRHYQNDPENPDSLSHNSIWTIYEERNGMLWLGTEGGGLEKFDPKSGKCSHYRSDPEDPYSLSSDDIRVVYKDQAGTLWVGTFGGGLNKFDRQTGQFIRYLPDPSNPHSLSHEEIRTIYEDRSGMIWVGTNLGGISKFNRKPKFISYQNDPGTANSLNDNLVFSFYEDQGGILWIGTWDGGLNRFDRKNGQFTHYQHDPKDDSSISENAIPAIYEDQRGNLWVATWDGGLNRLDRTTGHFTHYRHNPDDSASLSSDKLSWIYEDRSGALWIGTAFGDLNRFDYETQQFTRYMTDPDNTLQLTDNVIYAIYEDQTGAFWIGSNGGGFAEFDRKTGQILRYVNDPEDPASLSNNAVYALCEDQHGQLWIGTAGGLNKFDRSTKTFRHYTVKHGLPNNVIYGILEDSRGHLWLSTNRGIAEFDPQTETSKNYTVRDGLQSNEFNDGAYYKSRSGEMFFGGVNGFNAFFPEQIKDNPHIPPVVITDFQIFNKSVPIGAMLDGRTILERSIMETNALTLSYRDSVISFEFTALDYVIPQKNHYAYQLEGFDADWNYISGRRFVTYTNLPAGNYTFRVKAANNDGVWNEDGDMIRLAITPPFWETWWFQTLAILAIAGTLSGVYYVRMQSIKMQKHQLEVQVAERTHELHSSLVQVRKANAKITESLQYAQIIQQSLLPHPNELSTYLPESFLLWMPRELVGGDIIFTAHLEQGDVIAVADCTGHGVPGAFMTMLASSGLKRTIEDEGCHDPALILKHLNNIIKTVLQQDTPYAVSDDGLDAAICVINRNEHTLTFAGARLPLLYAQQGKMHMIKGDKQSLGYRRSNLNFEFTNHSIPLRPDMSFYLATDGFEDQLGGSDNKRFGTKRLRQVLLRHAEAPFAEQREQLLQALASYKDSYEQQDDITVVGFRVK